MYYNETDSLREIFLSEVEVFRSSDSESIRKAPYIYLTFSPDRFVIELPSTKENNNEQNTANWRHAKGFVETESHDEATRHSPTTDYPKEKTRHSPTIYYSKVRKTTLIISFLTNTVKSFT